MHTSLGIGPQKGPASHARLKAQLRSQQVAEEEQAVWQPLIDAVESRYGSKYCDYCGIEK